MMLTFDKGEKRFNFRAGGVAIHNGCLLTERDRRCDYRVVPGGRCEFLEDTRATVAREIIEEIGCPGEVGRLLWVVENFFRESAFTVHELGFFYEVKFPAGSPALAHSAPFAGAEATDFLSYEWVPFARLAELTLYPLFLAQRVASLPVATEHIIIDQLAQSVSEQK